MFAPKYGFSHCELFIQAQLVVIRLKKNHLRLLRTAHLFNHRIVPQIAQQTTPTNSVQDVNVNVTFIQ